MRSSRFHLIFVHVATIRDNNYRFILFVRTSIIYTVVGNENARAPAHVHTFWRFGLEITHTRTHTHAHTWRASTGKRKKREIKKKKKSPSARIIVIIVYVCTYGVFPSYRSKWTSPRPFFYTSLRRVRGRPDSARAAQIVERDGRRKTLELSKRKRRKKTPDLRIYLFFFSLYHFTNTFKRYRKNVAVCRLGAAPDNGSIVCV